VTSSARTSRAGRTTGSSAPSDDAPRTPAGARSGLAGRAFQLWVSPSNPPGFFRDEASIAYNAQTIATQGRDEYGARFPLYFTSFRDYKSPLFVYGLAGVFRVTGADREVARGFAAGCVLAAVLLLGWLAYRRTSHASVGVATVVLAGTTPWLFELGRVAFEVALEPLLLCLVLLAVERASRLGRWSTAAAIPVSLALGGITYVYAGGSCSRHCSPLRSSPSSIACAGAGC
jgi:hypothetical protein